MATLLDLMKVAPTVDWGVNTEELSYRKLKELDKSKVYNVSGLFINNKSAYGEQAVVISINDDESFMVGLNATDTAAIKPALENQEVIDSIKSGTQGFRVREFVSKKYNTTGYAIEIVEIKKSAAVPTPADDPGFHLDI